MGIADRKRDPDEAGADAVFGSKDLPRDDDRRCDDVIEHDERQANDGAPCADSRTVRTHALGPERNGCCKRGGQNNLAGRQTAHQ